MRFRLLLSLPLVFLSFVAGLQAQSLLVRGGWRFDTFSATFVPNGSLLVAGGRIVQLDGPPPAGVGELETVTLGENDYLLAGLIDLHAHYNLNLFERRRDEAEVNPALWLANGVTSTFPAGEYDPHVMKAAREEIDAGKRPGPRILRSGPYFGRARAGWDRQAGANWIEAEVARLAAQGVAGLKAKGIGALQLRPLIEAAHRHGLTVTAHLDSGFRGSVNPRDAILMGIDRIEHFMGGATTPAEQPAYASLERLDPASESVGKIIQLYLDARVNFDATLSAYGYFGTQKEAPFQFWQDEQRFLSPFVRQALAGRPERRVNERFERIYQVKKQTIKRLYDAGGGDLITLGTDHPSWGQYLAGFLAHREMQALVGAGLPPAAVLKIATINGAKALGLDRQLGSIEAGKLADFFVVAGDPSTDITRTRQIRMVFKAGRLYDPKQLLASVEGKLGPEDAEEAKQW